MRSLTFLQILPFLLLIPIFTAIAQWSNDPYENTLVAYQAFDPQMVSDGAGGAIIVWWSSSDYGLHAQRLDKYGYARWDSGGVFMGGVGWYQTEYFSLSEDGTGGCVVSFTDIYTQPPSSYARIYTQRIDSLGNKLWGDSGIPICDIDSIGVGGSHIVSDELGGYFVIWSDGRLAGGRLRVFGQHLDGSGNATWEPNGILISGTSNFYNEYSALVSGGSGYCIAIWDHLIQPGDRRPRVQRIDRFGNLLWGDEGDLFTETMSYYASRNRYISDGSGGVVATGYNQLTVSGGAVSGCTQRLDSTATFLWGESGVQFCDSIGPWPSHIPTQIAFNDSGTFYLWVNGVPTEGYNVYMQRINLTGHILWESNGVIISDTLLAGGIISIVSTSLCNVFCVWYESQNAVLNGQLLDSDSNNLWSGSYVPISYNTYGCSDLKTTSDNSGGAILCWTIYPAILYAQQLSSNGNLGEVLSVKEEPRKYIPTKITLLQNYPNPFNEATVVPIYIPQGEINHQTHIRIYNILGQQVRQLESPGVPSGWNYFLWDGTNDHQIPVSSGTYILQVKTQNYSRSIPIVKLR